MDVTDVVDVRGLDLLNADSDFGTVRTLFETSAPSALSKGKGAAEGTKDWVESDVDNGADDLRDLAGSADRNGTGGSNGVGGGSGIAAWPPCSTAHSSPRVSTARGLMRAGMKT